MLGKTIPIYLGVKYSNNMMYTTPRPRPSTRGRHGPGHRACVPRAACIILGILIHTIYIYNRVIYDVIHEHDTHRPVPDPSMDRWIDRSIDGSIRSIDAMGRGVPIDPFVDARPSKSRSVSRARCIRRRIRIHRSRLSLDGIAEDDDRGRRGGDDARMTSSASHHHPAPPPPGRVMTHRVVVVTNRMMMMSSNPR